MKVRPFLTSEELDLRVLLEVFFNDKVAFNILVELLIAKLVDGFKLDNRRMSQEVRDFSGSVKNAEDNRGIVTLKVRLQILHANFIVLYKNASYIQQHSLVVVYPLYLTMELSYQTIPQKYKKSLKAEDFVVLSQENQEYRNLLKIMTQKQALLTHQVTQLTKKVERLENEKEEYKIKSHQYASKLHQYEILKEQIAADYKMLKKQIDQKVTQTVNYEQQIASLSQQLDKVNETYFKLQQEDKKKDILIQQLQESITKMQGEVMDKKLKMFSQLLEHSEKKIIGTQPNKNKQNPRRKFQQSFVESKTQSQMNSLGTSNINSISFSLISNESGARSKVTSRKNSAHHKSIYV